MRRISESKSFYSFASSTCVWTLDCTTSGPVEVDYCQWSSGIDLWATRPATAPGQRSYGQAGWRAKARAVEPGNIRVPLPLPLPSSTSTTLTVLIPFILIQADNFNRDSPLTLQKAGKVD